MTLNPITDCIHDIFVYYPTIYDHLSRLTDVFLRLGKTNLKTQLDKCKEVDYLVLVKTKNGVKANRNKLDCIMHFCQLQTETDMKSFLGVAGYYHQDLIVTLTKFPNH